MAKRNVEDAFGNKKSRIKKFANFFIFLVEYFFKSFFSLKNFGKKFLKKFRAIAKSGGTKSGARLTARTLLAMESLFFSSLNAEKKDIGISFFFKAHRKQGKSLFFNDIIIVFRKKTRPRGL
jgi:hypothetical protein